LKEVLEISWKKIKVVFNERCAFSLDKDL